MDELHRYAVNEHGKTVFIKDITPENRHNKFYCINCGSEMIPVLGLIREKHFRHKVVTPNCNYESYIHKIGKEKLKERFYSQETFPISYYIEYTCTKTSICKFKEKLNNLKCNKREKKTIDLKQYYDTCEEEKTYKGFRADLMLSSSKYPELKPIFIEISYTHDCTREKVASGIQIIEVKVEDDLNFSMSFDEHEVMFMDFLSNNPYVLNAAPPVRFYNFPRQERFSIPLNRFVLYKTEEGTIAGFNLTQKTNCQDFEYEHIPIVEYEFVTSEEIMMQEQRNNIYAYGMAMAIKKGYPVKHCSFCRRHFRGYGGCIMSTTKEDVNKSTGEKYLRHIRVWTSTLNSKQIDRVAVASRCRNFILNQNIVQKMLIFFESVPYWDWENKNM